MAAIAQRDAFVGDERLAIAEEGAVAFGKRAELMSALQGSFARGSGGLTWSHRPALDRPTTAALANGGPFSAHRLLFQIAPNMHTPTFRISQKTGRGRKALIAPSHLPF